MMECKPRKCGLFLALVLLVALCSCAKVESIETSEPNSVENTSVESTAVESEEGTGEESAGRENSQKNELDAISSISYSPAELENEPLQVYDFGSDANRVCLRKATSDSSEYVMVLWSDEGSDAVDLNAAVPSDARGGAASVIPYDAIQFAQDAHRYESNLPKDGDAVLYFNENGTDYFVYGTFPLDELVKVADGVSAF